MVSSNNRRPTARRRQFESHRPGVEPQGRRRGLRVGGLLFLGLLLYGALTGGLRVVESPGVASEPPPSAPSPTNSADSPQVADQATEASAPGAKPAAQAPAKKSPAKKPPAGKPAPGADPQGLALFEKRIRPALVEHCYACHSREKGEPKGGLLVDSREGLLQGGESGAALVPGNPDDSLLLEALRHEGLEMPPEKKLPAELIADFAEWIRRGAPDPRKGDAAPRSSKKIDLAEGRKFWAFQPLTRTTPPQPRQAAWPRSDIDRYLLAALEAQGLEPVADADRRTLLRRLSLDLTGIPPTPAEMEAWLADTSPQALEKVVDRLLESPRFGERWARYWLDVARYAESNGNTDNITYPHAWRYRDYVIDSLQRDKPFDRFLIEQIAGDLLPAESPAQRDEQLTATGFLALGSKPRAQNNPDFQMDVVADQIEVTTTAFLGLTVACARCHDHKFDPIPTEDYYALAGIFTSTEALYSGGGGKGNGRLPNTGFHALSGTVRRPPSTDTEADAGEPPTVDAELARLRAERDTLEIRLRRAGAEIVTVAREENPGTPGNSPKKNKKKAAKKKAAAAGAASGDGVQVVRVPDNASAQDRRRIANLERQWRDVLSRLATFTPGEGAASGDEAKDDQGTSAEPGWAMGVRDSRRPGDCQICLRGDSEKRGPEIPRGLVSVIPSSAGVRIPADQSGRLELARWMASPDHPLTARVYVNRIWRHLFGRGLVPTVDNFGALGERPSHPELLDHLAAQFLADGWSTKRLIRSLVLTRAYGLSSATHAAGLEKDPDNVYLWRHQPRRLDAEALRDSLLAVTGSLRETRPHGSAVATLGEQVVQGKKGQVDLGANAAVYRSIYLPIVRNAMPEMLELFDVADPSLVVGSRDVTTVPAQSLFLLNSPMVVRQAQHWALQLRAARPDDPTARIDLAFLQALGRHASAAEQEAARHLIQRAASASGAGGGSEDAAWSCFTQALLASAEFRYVE